MDLPLLFSASILLVWVVLSVGLVILAAYFLRRGIGGSPCTAAGRVGFIVAGIALFTTFALHNPLTIHVVQQARAAQMSQYQGHELAEFEQAYGPPDYWAGPFPSWRTLPWYSPMRWGSVTLAVLDNGSIGSVMVRGFWAAFT